MSQPADQYHPLSNRQLRYLRLIFAGMLLALCLFGVMVYPQIVLSNYDHAIEQLIFSLAERRPPELSRGQWSAAVGWTSNLHGNSLLAFEADAKTLAAFQARLQRKLEEPVNLQTIDWIWDEYSRLTPHGKRYQEFKPVMNEYIEGSAQSDVDSWQTGVK